MYLYIINIYIYYLRIICVCVCVPTSAAFPTMTQPSSLLPARDDHHSSASVGANAGTLRALHQDGAGT